MEVGARHRQGHQQRAVRDRFDECGDRGIGDLAGAFADRGASFGGIARARQRASHVGEQRGVLRPARELAAIAGPHTHPSVDRRDEATP
jgi:hypothetical protein